MNRAHLYQSTVKAIPFPEMARMTPTLLSPLAALAALMACWRFGVDTGWTGSFAVADGLLSHWQVWLAAAIGIQWLAHRLQMRAK